MSHLTSADKHFFKENGCLIVRGALTSAQIQAAQDALWTGIDADRDDPATWIEAGPAPLCPPITRPSTPPSTSRRSLR